VPKAVDIHGTRLLQKTLEFGESDYKILVHEGSSGSSKTFSVAQALMLWSFQQYDKTYSIVRKTLPALKRSALRDWKAALNISGLYYAFQENKTDLFFTNKATKTTIEFFALDNEQKARGPRRDILWPNDRDWETDLFYFPGMHNKGPIC